jgi:predicted TIM-barrel fold metal-dependent hydrolase
MTTGNLRPRRRDILAGGLALTALRARPARAAPAPPAAVAAVEIDVHCHSFCAADLPIVGFVAHYIPGLTDLSRELTRWPEVVVREIVGIVTKLPNAVTPSAPAEIATLQSALANRSPIAPVPMLSDESANRLLGRALVLVPFLVNSRVRQTLARYLSTLYVAAHARAAIAASMVETYGAVSLFTPCLVDYDEWSDDRAPTALCDQIAIQTLIAQLSIRGQLPRAGARIHPFVAFDPRREVVRRLAGPQDAASYRPFGDGRIFDPASVYVPASAPPPAINRDSGALEMVRHAIEAGGFLGVKVYPPVGFAPLENARLRSSEPELSPRLDLALRALYAYCEAEEVPITAHTSAGNEYGIGFRELVGPDRWAPVMRLYPNLRLNLGHFGHDYGIDRAHGVNTGAAWIRQAAALIQVYPNVYADLSNSPLVFDPEYAARYVPYLREIVARFPKVKARLMYGSDWWLNRLQAGSESFPAAIRLVLAGARTAEVGGAALFGAEEMADVMGRNALRFLGFLDEGNQPRAGRAARRLRVFYDGLRAAPPVWVA